MKMNQCLSLLRQVSMVFLFACFLLPAPGECRPSDGGDERVALDYQNIELGELIKTMSELTGRNFVFDEKDVKGKVTIISPDAMSQEEAYQLFLSVLSVKGYTLVQSNKVNKVIPIKDAKESSLPVFNRTQGDNYVTHLIRLQYADAQTLVSAALAPLVSKNSNVSVYEPTNTIILTDNAANIERLLKIIKRLDVPASLGNWEVFKLQYADAEFAAKIASSFLSKKPAPTGRRNAGTQQDGLAIANPRTNALLVLASAEELGLLRQLIAAIDIPGGKERSSINVYTLKNADAESLAKSLNEIMAHVKLGKDKKNGSDIESLAITAVTSTNSLLISAEPEDYNQIRQVIEQLDIKPHQVFVEALILELSMDATREVGISLQGAFDVNDESVILGTGNLNTGSVGLGSFTPTTDGGVPGLLTQTIEGLMLGGLFNPITTIAPDGTEITIPALSALIQLSQTSNDVNILSAPTLLTSDNKEAEIIVGSNVPIITNRLTDTSNPSSQSVSVERKDVALTLRFTPQITEGNLVQLDIFQEITDLSQVTVGDVDEVGPTLTKRQLRNTVLAENGKTVTLGGLIGTNIQSKEFKIPLLGDIPFLGRLFRTTSTKTLKTNLLVFMTPQIIRDGRDLETITRKARATGYKLQSEGMRQELMDSSVGSSFLIDVLSDGEPEKVPAPHE